MEDIRKKHLQIAKNTLKKLFATLKDKGLLSVYLWGSILRDEYTPGVSDVDALGITEDGFSATEDKSSNSFLKEHAPELYDFRINFIRFSELNGAIPVTHLAQVTPAPLMLVLFPDWQHVCGKKYQRSDFHIATPTHQQVIQLSLGVLDNFYLPSLVRSDFTKFKSVVKRIMHICHFIHQIEKGPHPFSYMLLRKNMSQQTKDTIGLLFRMKEEGYRSPDENELKALLGFLESTRQRYTTSNYHK